MSTISTILRDKTVRKVFNFTTADTLAELQRHIKYNVINPAYYVLAKVDYNAHVGLPCGETDEVIHNENYYPLKFISYNGREELWLSCVTAGYSGEGPHGTLKALRLMGFDVPGDREEELFTIKEAHFEFLK